MVKRTKIKSKDDITWIKPETKKVNKTAAKCAQNKEKTSNLIKLHEEKIKDAVKNKKDEIKRIKVKVNPIKTQKFQIMHTQSGDPEEATSQMKLVIDEDIKLEDLENGLTEQGDEQWPDSDPRWTDDTVYPITTIGSEIDEVLRKDDMEERLEELRTARMTVDSLKDEIADRIDDDEKKEALEDIEYHTHSKYDSPLEEYEAESSSDSCSGSNGDYEFPNELSETKAKPREMRSNISKNQEVEENEDTNDLNVIEQIQHQYTPPSSKRTRSSAPPPPRSTGTKSRSSPNSAKGSTATSPNLRSSPTPGSTGTRRRSSPQSAKGSKASSPSLRSMRKSRPRASPPRRSLIVVSTSKRKYQEDYDRLEAMEEQVTRNIDTMWELARYKKKSLTDDEEKLRLSRALLCKKELMSLEENCTADDYIYFKYSNTM